MKGDGKMRIGEFAQKHNTTHDTIRHYLDMGLLITEKKGGHYRFDESDSWDLENIIELKAMGFSLSEIQELLCYHRLAGDMTIEYRKYYLSLLEDKKKDFEEKIEKYKTMGTLISDKIMRLQSDEDKLSKLGLPLSSIEIIKCPYCGSTMEIFNGIIEKSMIMAGKIKCKCGFIASIENGIYVDEKAVKEKKLNSKTMPTKKEFLNAASPKFINFYYNGMAKSIDYILRYTKEPKYILELDHCVGSFLMQYIKNLPKDSTYILVCYDKDRLTNIKTNIEFHYSHSNFIFLCCDIDRLPIGNSSVDLIIDHGVTKIYAETEDKSLPIIYSSLMKEKGILVGTYHYFDKKSKDFESLLPEKKEVYNREKNLERLEDASFEKLEITDTGPIIENNPFNLDIRNRELYMTVYAGRKKGNETLG